MKAPALGSVELCTRADIKIHGRQKRAGAPEDGDCVRSEIVHLHHRVQLGR